MRDVERANMMNAYFSSIGTKLAAQLPLESLFKSSFKTGNLEWKTAKLTTVHKKDDETDRGNYRPLSILSVPSKILESCVNDTIVDHVLNFNRLASNGQPMGISQGLFHWASSCPFNGNLETFNRHWLCGGRGHHWLQESLWLRRSRHPAKQAPMSIWNTRFVIKLVVELSYVQVTVHGLEWTKIQPLPSVFWCPPMECPGADLIYFVHKWSCSVHPVRVSLYVCWWYHCILYWEDYRRSVSSVKSNAERAVCLVREEQADTTSKEIRMYANL